VVSETDILVAEGVRKVYRTASAEVVALHDVDLSVPEGDFVAVLGPSGSGKTTLLNCLSGLDDIARMSDAERTRHRATTMGFVFQAFNLIPVFSAVENVELPLLLAGVRERAARKRADVALQQIGLGHRLEHRPSELSGGEQQRVAIARAIVGRPRLGWADEPTGNLDSETAAQVMVLLDELNASGTTMVLVTHDERVGAAAKRRVRMLDGRIVSDRRDAEEDAASTTDAAVGVT